MASEHKHVLFLSGSPEPVLDHRFLNPTRNIGDDIKVTTVNPRTIMERDPTRPILDQLDEHMAKLEDIQFTHVWTNWHGIEAAAVMEWAKQEKGSRIILDYDDLVDTAPPWHPNANSFMRFRRDGIKATQAVADVKVASTPLLKEHFDCDLLAPNFADPENWVAPEVLPKQEDLIRIVFPISTSREVEWEELMTGPVRHILDNCPNVQAVFVGGWPEWTDFYPVGQVSRVFWMPLALYKKFLPAVQPDIICSALLEHDFSNSRSNLKWLEAGTVGAAFLGSNVGELKRTISSGKDGILVDDEGWLPALEGVVGDAKLRKSLAEGARESVTRDWTWPAVRDQWMEVFK